MQELDISYAFALPPDKIIPYFQSKGIVITGSWKELWQEAHHKAFTMANVFSMDVLQTVKQGVDKAIAEGIPYEQFKKENGGTLELAGINPNRLHTVYRTNMQVAYQTGRYKELLEETHGIENREYWQYVSVIDPSTTDQCRGLNGRVYKYTDSFWKTYYPPNHFNCRATVQSLSKEMLQERGLKVSGAYHGDPPAEGWDYNPAVADYKPELKKYDPAIVKQYKKALANEIDKENPLLSAFTISSYLTGEALNNVTDSFELVNKVIKVPKPDNGYDLRPAFYTDNGIRGEYSYEHKFLQINEFHQNSKGEMRSTIPHELGHLIDTEFLGKKGAGLNVALGSDLMETPAIKRLMYKIYDSECYKGILRDISKTQNQRLKEHYEYKAEAPELFARAFSQFILEENGLPIDSGLIYNKYQWGSEDFAPIKDKFRALFKKLKWLRDGEE